MLILYEKQRQNYEIHDILWRKITEIAQYVLKMQQVRLFPKYIKYPPWVRALCASRKWDNRLLKATCVHKDCLHNKDSYVIKHTCCLLTTLNSDE
jgi:hypothetical protein